MDATEYPADLTMRDGTTHRIWLNDDGRVVRVDSDAIPLEAAQAECDRICAEATL